MAEDETRAVAYDGRPENLGCAQDRAVGGALVAADFLNHLAFGVQQQDAHLV